MREKKLNKITRNFVINEIVLVKNENIPRSIQLLAHIIDVHVGNHGIVRSCKIKLGNNILVRPGNKFCLLEEVDETDVSIRYYIFTSERECCVI